MSEYFGQISGSRSPMGTTQIGRVTSITGNIEDTIEQVADYLNRNGQLTLTGGVSIQIDKWPINPGQFYITIGRRRPTKDSWPFEKNTLPAKGFIYVESSNVEHNDLDYIYY